MRTSLFPAIFLLILSACSGARQQPGVTVQQDLFLVVLGVAQDGGYPHAGCRRACCQLVAEGKQKPQSPVCLGLVDRRAGKAFMIEATPDFAGQWRHLQDVAGCADKKAPDGIFVTHAHIGHYIGLLQLGREVMGASRVPVWTMPRMERFLWENGPWRQLIELENIDSRPLWADSTVQLTADLRITPFRVPHRDEYSETVGYRIESANRQVVFIPDIDKWENWSADIVEVVRHSNVALIDATFFRDGELTGRSMKEVPHPFVVETMQRFAAEPAQVKERVSFIHFNHTNPLLWDDKARKEVQKAGFTLAGTGMVIPL